jgi:hypothetical protein
MTTSEEYGHDVNILLVAFDEKWFIFFLTPHFKIFFPWAFTNEIGQNGTSKWYSSFPFFTFRRGVRNKKQSSNFIIQMIKLHSSKK